MTKPGTDRVMAEIATTPQAAQLSAAQKLKQREDGIRAAAIKQGRQYERADMLKALGVKALEDASQLAQIRAERDARPTPTEEAKHGRHRFWQGMAMGLSGGVAIGSAMVALAFAWSMRESFDNAAQYGSRMVVSGAALQGASPPTRCVPGETLDDGRVCP